MSTCKECIYYDVCKLKNETVFIGTPVNELVSDKFGCFKSKSEVSSEVYEEEIKPILVCESYFYDMNYSISVLLASYRIKHGLSQNDLAKILGVAQSTISDYENGDYNFDLSTLSKICAKLGAQPILKFTEAASDDCSE